MLALFCACALAIVLERFTAPSSTSSGCVVPPIMFAVPSDAFTLTTLSSLVVIPSCFRWSSAFLSGRH